jgi:hypothetical protein
MRYLPCARRVLAAATVVTGGFVVFAVATLYSIGDIFCAIGNKNLITGSTKFFTPTGYFDLAMLEPSVGDPSVLAGNDKYVGQDVL